MSKLRSSAAYKMHSSDAYAAVCLSLSREMEFKWILVSVLLGYVVHAEAVNPLKAVLSEIQPGKPDRYCYTSH